MKSLKLLILYICVCLAISVNSVKCDEDDSLFQYDGETSMSNIDDANKEIYEDVSVFSIELMEQLQCKTIIMGSVKLVIALQYYSLAIHHIILIHSFIHSYTRYFLNKKKNCLDCKSVYT